MSKAFRNSVLILTAVSTLGVLASCGRRDRPVVDLRQKEDPRMLKAFGANEDRFCSFQLPDADAAMRVTVLGDSKGDLLTNLNATCAKLAAAPKAKCEEFAADERSYPCVAPSILNGEAAKTGLWTCTLPFTANDVDEMITSENQSTADAAISGIFVACAELTDEDDAGKSATAASTDAADAAAPSARSDELVNLALTIVAAPSPLPSPTPSTLPSPTPSPVPTATPRTYTTPSKRRDACAAALLAEKLTCTNANDYPVITPSPKPPRRLHH